MEFVNFLISRVIFNICVLFLNVCKHTFYISHVRISQKKKKGKMYFTVKSSTYYFHMMMKILTDFQICISVTLSIYLLQGFHLLCLQNRKMKLVETPFSSKKTLVPSSKSKKNIPAPPIYNFFETHQVQHVEGRNVPAMSIIPPSTIKFTFN